MMRKYADVSRVKYILHNKNAFVYLGHVYCNRYKSLVAIGQALKTINDKKNSDYKLKIYSM